MAYNNGIGIEHGMISVAFVLSAVCFGLSFYIFQKNSFKSPDYSAVSSGGFKIIKLALALAIISLLLSLCGLLVKEAPPLIKVGFVYLILSSLMSCIVLGLMSGKKPVSRGLQISITLLNVPIIIVLIVVFILGIKSGGL